MGPMPQSLSKVIVHIIFSTKNREPWLDSAIRPRMHAYLATIGRDLGGEGLCVNGVADHVHIVTTLPRTLSQAELIENEKMASLGRLVAESCDGLVGIPMAPAAIQSLNASVAGSLVVYEAFRQRRAT